MADRAQTVEELQAALETSKKENSTLKGQLTVATKNLETKDAELEAKKNENEGLKSQVGEAMVIIQQQNEALTKAEESGPDVIITFDKKKYKVTAPSFNFAGNAVTAAELKENKAMQAELIKRKSGILLAVD